MRQEIEDYKVIELIDTNISRRISEKVHEPLSGHTVQ
jgi:hypothetical protein